MSSAAEIIRRLGGNPHTGMCRCPAHDDQHPSLKVKEENGKVLFHCHAKCSQEQVMAALKARGIDWRSQSRPARVWTEYPPEQEAYHKFRKALAILRAGTGAIGAVREWRRPDAQKELLPYFNGRGIDKVPINALFLSAMDCLRLKQQGVPAIKAFPAMVLPIVGAKGLQGALVTQLSKDGSRKLAAKQPRHCYGALKGGYVQLGELNPDQPLIVAEGVESALAAAQITGLPAIAALSATNLPNVLLPSNGEVIIAADNDDTGMEAATKLAQRLLAAERKRIVRIVAPEPPPGVAKYDWNDALRDGRKDGTDFVKLRSEILTYPPVEESETAPDGYAISTEALMDIAFPPHQYIVEPWLETSSLMMLYAKRGVGKTRFMMSIGYAIACGSDFLGWKIDKPHRVLYVDGELPGAKLQERFKVHGISPQIEVLSRDILLRFHRIAIPDLGTPEGREFVETEIEAKQPEVVILDSLSTLIRSGTENDAESWSPVQDWLMELRLRGITVIILHHEGKTETQRGTSKREDVLDTIIRLKEPKGDMLDEGDAAHGCVFELHFMKARDYYGADRAPRVLRLSTQSGTAEWTWEALRDQQQERIAELHQLGRTQNQIAKEMGVDQSTVSRILAKALRKQRPVKVEK
jgi:putative DNA primase/helicase